MSNESRLGKSNVQMNFMVSRQCCSRMFRGPLWGSAQALRVAPLALATTAAHQEATVTPSSMSISSAVLHKKAMSLSNFHASEDHLDSDPASTRTQRGARHVNYTNSSLLPSLCTASGVFMSHFCDTHNNQGALLCRIHDCLV